MPGASVRDELLAYYAFSAYTSCMQYTIRNVPDALDAMLRDRAKKEGKSLNEMVIEALARAMGFSRDHLRSRDLSGIAGSWIEDPEFDRAIEDQDRIAEDLWR